MFTNQLLQCPLIHENCKMWNAFKATCRTYFLHSNSQKFAIWLDLQPQTAPSKDPCLRKNHWRHMTWFSCKNSPNLGLQSVQPGCISQKSGDTQTQMLNAPWWPSTHGRVPIWVDSFPVRDPLPGTASLRFFRDATLRTWARAQGAPSSDVGKRDMPETTGWIWLVVDLPLWKMMESVGMMKFPIWWESHKIPWFQTTNQYMKRSWIEDSMVPWMIMNLIWIIRRFCSEWQNMLDWKPIPYQYFQQALPWHTWHPKKGRKKCAIRLKNQSLGSHQNSW